MSVNGGQLLLDASEVEELRAKLAEAEADAEAAWQAAELRRELLRDAGIPDPIKMTPNGVPYRAKVAA